MYEVLGEAAIHTQRILYNWHHGSGSAASKPVSVCMEQLLSVYYNQIMMVWGSEKFTTSSTVGSTRIIQGEVRTGRVMGCGSKVILGSFPSSLL